MNELPTRAYVAEDFVRRATFISCDSVIESINELLERPQDSPLYHHLTVDQTSQIAWYQGLDQTSRQIVRQLLTFVATNSVSNFLVFLDNLTGGRPIPTVPSGYALFVHVYDDDRNGEVFAASEPKIALRINDLSGGLGLHDEFSRLQKEAKETETGKTEEGRSGKGEATL